eukprot:226770-Alexandrium_andersonii.AAC.1
MREWATEGFLVWPRPGLQRRQARAYVIELSRTLWERSSAAPGVFFRARQPPMVRAVTEYLVAHRHLR